MWAIWAKQLLPKALKSCPKSNKSPNLVTLVVEYTFHNLRRLKRGRGKKRKIVTDDFHIFPFLVLSQNEKNHF